MRHGMTGSGSIAVCSGSAGAVSSVVCTAKTGAAGASGFAAASRGGMKAASTIFGRICPSSGFFAGGAGVRRTKSLTLTRPPSSLEADVTAMNGASLLGGSGLLASFCARHSCAVMLR